MFHIGQLITFSDRAYQEEPGEFPDTRGLVLRVLHIHNEHGAPYYIDVELVNKAQLPDYEDYLLSGWLDYYYKPLPIPLYRRQTCH